MTGAKHVSAQVFDQWLINHPELIRESKTGQLSIVDHYKDSTGAVVASRIMPNPKAPKRAPVINPSYVIIKP